MLEDRRGSHVFIRVPQRGDKRALMETVARNAQEILIKHKTTRAGDLSTRNRALEEIQDALELPAAPLRIECYDISNLQGTEVVGSMVVFEDGLPRKSEYRRFVIRHVEGQNDVAAMHEVITRRFRRLIDDRAAMKRRLAAEQGADFDDEEGPLLIDPTTWGASQVRVHAVAGGGRRRTAAGGRSREGPARTRHR
jgi:excinuclease ABC subunit C